MNEIWKDVFEYEGIYQISNLGNIKSLDRIIVRKDGAKYIKHGALMKPKIRKKDGFVVIKLSKEGITKMHSIARLVYKAFNNNFNYHDRNIIIWHKDLDQQKNSIDNLIAIKRMENPMNPPKETRWDKKPVICITTNKKFNSILEAEDFYNIKKNNGIISRCCRGKLEYAGILGDGTKLVWKYLE